jgi:hypothetical protein
MSRSSTSSRLPACAKSIARGRRGWFRPLASCCLLLPMLLVMTPANSASAASTSSRVTVSTLCPAGQDPVGMWYRTQFGGAQGWAQWGPNTGYQQFTFTVPSTITDVYLSIGCGGSRARWTNSYPAAINVFRIPSQNFTVNCSVRKSPDCAVTYVQR